MPNLPPPWTPSFFHISHPVHELILAASPSHYSRVQSLLSSPTTAPLHPTISSGLDCLHSLPPRLPASTPAPGSLESAHSLLFIQNKSQSTSNGLQGAPWSPHVPNTYVIPRPTAFPLTHSVLATLVSLLFLDQAKDTHTSGFGCSLYLDCFSPR